MSMNRRIQKFEDSGSPMRRVGFGRGVVVSILSTQPQLVRAKIVVGEGD